MSDTVSIPVVEEEFDLTVQKVITGRVRVETKTEIADEEVRAELVSEAVDVVRVPVNRDVDRVPDVRVEGNVTILPVVEEVLFVERRLVLKEEVHITRRSSTDTVEITVPIKKQKLTISRSENGRPDGPKPGEM